MELAGRRPRLALADAAIAHAEVSGLDDDRHALGIELLLDRVGDLGGELLLDLQSLREALYSESQQIIALRLMVRDSATNEYFFAEGEASIVSQGYGIAVASIVTTIIYLLLALAFHNSTSIWLSILPTNMAQGHSGRASLSNFQVGLWTLIVVFSAVYVHTVSGSALHLDSSILALLGIASLSSLAARTAASKRGAARSLEEDLADQTMALEQADLVGGPGDDVQPEPPVASPEARTTTVTDFVQTHGRADILKAQMFIFTLLSAGYVLYEVWFNATIPEIPNELLILMGISNGSYAAPKFSN